MHTYISCFFYLIGDGNGSVNGWVASQGISNSGLYEKYVTAFYWAVMTMCARSPVLNAFILKLSLSLSLYKASTDLC